MLRLQNPWRPAVAERVGAEWTPIVFGIIYLFLGLFIQVVAKEWKIGGSVSFSVCGGDIAVPYAFVRSCGYNVMRLGLCDLFMPTHLVGGEWSLRRWFSWYLHTSCFFNFLAVANDVLFVHGFDSRYPENQRTR